MTNIATGPIFCLSQLHVGTWTTISWLCEHPDVKGLVLSTGVYDVLAGKDGESHAMKSGIRRESFHRKMVYHEHVRTDHRFSASMSRTQLMMAALFRTVIPLRDPLAALVSYQHRAEIDGRIGTEDFDPVGHVVFRWVVMATEESLKRCGPIFLPWDTLGKRSPESAARLLKGLAMMLGLFDGPTGGIWDNDSGDYLLRRAYDDGDLATLEDKVVGLKQLRNREPQLRPFLEGVGYKNLIWWS